MSQATELIARQMAAGSANARVWADILYNVKLYGAKGDGTTDDTASVQATIDAAIAAGGKAVFFPHGTYKVTALTNLSSVVLFGDNASFVGITDTINQIGSPTSNLAINVKDFGAKGDGVADDSAAINAALTAASNAGGGTVVLPPGKYYVSSTITVPGNVTLCGFSVDSNVNNSTVMIVGSLTLSPIVTLDGISGNTSASLKNLAVTRVAGSIPVGTVGVRVQNTDYPVIEDMNISRHAIGLDIVGNLGFVGNRVIVYSSTDAHCQIAGIQVSFTDCTFGRDGGENGIIATNVIKITGNADTITFNRCQLNPTVTGSTNIVNFYNFTSTNGIIKFTSCHMENALNMFASNSGTSMIAKLVLTGCTMSVGVSNNFVSLNAATSAIEWILNGNNIAGIFTLNKGAALTVSNNRFSGAVTLGLDSANVTGNTFNTFVTLNGTWKNLVFACNVFDGIAQAITDNSSGVKTIFGNVSTTGYSNANILSDNYLTLGTGVPFAIKRLSGTLNASGTGFVAHGTDTLKGLIAQAFYKDASGNMVPMSINAIDATNVNVTGGVPNAKFRVVLMYSSLSDNW